MSRPFPKNSSQWALILNRRRNGGRSHIENSPLGPQRIAIARLHWTGGAHSSVDNGPIVWVPQFVDDHGYADTAEKSWALALAALVNAWEAYDFMQNIDDVQVRVSEAILMPGKQYRRTFEPRPSSKLPPCSGIQYTMPENRSLIRFQKTCAYVLNHQWIIHWSLWQYISRYFRLETHDGTEFE
ncbi:hypothetical protein B0H13DRAFT_1873317 [Mycena leptocephala]|nr:hypothetical protein B0H13DRAFT_1873317 [Mycena leptocephala]